MGANQLVCFPSATMRFYYYQAEGLPKVAVNNSP
jgi:hypothetical protein